MNTGNPSSRRLASSTSILGDIDAADKLAILTTMVNILNRAFADDPYAIHAMFTNFVPCNESLANHDSVIVDDNPVVGIGGQYRLGVLGLINGIVEPTLGIPIAIKWSEIELGSGPPEFLGFCLAAD